MLEELFCSNAQLVKEIAMNTTVRMNETSLSIMVSTKMTTSRRTCAVFHFEGDIKGSRSRDVQAASASRERRRQRELEVPSKEQASGGEIK